MARIPRWERLFEALARVREATGLSQTEAQADICRAIADGAIRFQGALGKLSTRPMTSKGTILDNDHFQIPRDLKPTDFDWSASRPLEPWLVRREFSKTPGRWYLDWIELLRTDVNALGEPEGGGAATQRAENEVKRRTRPALELAERAIAVLYPTGVPSQVEEPNAVLCRKVGGWFKENGHRNLSDDTIVRAAGRRR